MPLRRLYAFVLSAVIVPLIAGCSFSWTLNGSAIDYNIYKTVAIGNFPIRAALVYPQLQTIFETELLNYVSRNTRLQVTDPPADLQIEGEIVGYDLTPQAVTQDAYASQTRLTIKVHVIYTDNKNEKKSFDQTFSAYKDFDASQLLVDVQDELCQTLSEELIIQIFNATLGDW